MVPTIISGAVCVDTTAGDKAMALAHMVISGTCCQVMNLSLMSRPGPIMLLLLISAMPRSWTKPQ